jgi:selenocysteine-specific translation elongation factor
VHLVVFIYDSDLAGYIGKKSSEEGIVFYNRTFDGNVIVGLSAVDLEKKIHNVAQAMLMSNKFVISTKNIDKTFGELIIGSELCGKPVIFTDENNIEKITSGLNLNYTVSNKENILSEIMAKTADTENGKQDFTRIDIDAAFNVKGIGCVALGIVTKGAVNVHDTLFHSSGKQVLIKSIQSQDIDIKTAGINTRVGLALKGIDSEDIGKGDLITSEKVSSVSSIDIEFKASRFAGENVEIGGRYVFISNFSYRACLVEKIEGNHAKISFEKPIAIEKNDAFLLLRNAAPRIFAAGTVL